MKRVVLSVVSTIASLVLLLSFKTHSPTAAAGAAQSVASGSETSDSASSAATAATPSPSTTASSSSSTRASTKKKAGSSTATSYTGTAVETRYGPVQVKVTVKGGKVTGVTAVEYPDSNPRDAQINSYAIPALDSEAEQAGTAKIDTISGATYTSDGYLSSLQSALDKAGV